jgi:arginine-tRNA-protein transferase
LGVFVNGRHLLSSFEQREILVHDAVEPCPYLADHRARLPLRLPVVSLDWAEADESLARGDRRHGALLYRPECPDCDACEAIRLPIADFRPNKSQRRARNRGNSLLDVELAHPTVSQEKLALYEKHKSERGLNTPGAAPLGPKGYRRFLVDSCVMTYELRYLHEGELVGVAILDRGATAASAVYCFYDPEVAARLKVSLGTFSIMIQVELCRRWDLTHLYLGLYIADNPSMAYKGGFTPHERRIDGNWRRFVR